MPALTPPCSCTFLNWDEADLQIHGWCHVLNLVSAPLSHLVSVPFSRNWDLPSMNWFWWNFNIKINHCHCCCPVHNFDCDELINFLDPTWIMHMLQMTPLLVLHQSHQNLSLTQHVFDVAHTVLYVFHWHFCHTWRSKHWLFCLHNIRQVLSMCLSPWGSNDDCRHWLASHHTADCTVLLTDKLMKSKAQFVMVITSLIGSQEWSAIKRLTLRWTEDSGWLVGHNCPYLYQYKFHTLKYR